MEASPAAEAAMMQAEAEAMLKATLAEVAKAKEEAVTIKAETAAYAAQVRSQLGSLLRRASDPKLGIVNQALAGWSAPQISTAVRESGEALWAEAGGGSRWN